ncbi:unnamed protein product [Coffea canephora]|uniref:Uncharacterized protein n=1 Tax=Coffea canephora TaxID=49390 RepID=A0A068VE03_COFCA|nr:unnamed protein product [Coffea canephora]
MEEEHETSSLRARRKKSSVTLRCCFNGHRRADSLDAPSSSSVLPSPSSSRRMSPSAWIRSKTNELPDVKIKGTYRGLMSCMRRHRRHSSADFSYDPLSYSLNFEDDDHESSEGTGEFPMRSFAARLPLSPPRSATGDGDQIRMKQQPQMTSRTTPQPTIAGSPSTTRAAAVAEVLKSLQQLDVETPAGRTRGTPELSPPIHNTRKQQHLAEEIRKSRSSDHDHAGELMRRSLDLPHPPPTPGKVILTSTTPTTSASTTTPTSRQVLVELF